MTLSLLLCLAISVSGGCEAIGQRWFFASGVDGSILGNLSAGKLELLTQKTSKRATASLRDAVLPSMIGKTVA
jgi:hypothetical protein